MYSSLTAASPEVMAAEVAYRREALTRAWHGTGRHPRWSFRWARRDRRAAQARHIPAQRRALDPVARSHAGR